MTKIRAILVDDEIMNLQGLKRMISDTKLEVDIVDTCSSPKEAIISIIKNMPDVIFLDIAMPGMNGFQLLEHLSYLNADKFNVVFVTAYDQYALQAFKLNAIDYLLKPILEKDLYNTLKKISDNLAFKRYEERVLSVEKNDKPIFSTLGTKHLLKMNNIIYAGASGNYTQIFVDEKSGITNYLTSYPISTIEASLPSDRFFRIHRSYIVNSSYIQVIKRNEHGDNILVCSVGEIVLPISRRRYSDVMERLTHNRL